ncbi:hypothetical protein DFH29DRAFT_1000372 [Suillus ampliporus]|nr:hypothetical protein DFH29DRAFT_1000372 [Suillus ampliporus]
MFSGPLGMERELTLEEDCLPYEWSHVSLCLYQSAKGMYFLNISESLQQFDPYFAPLLPLVQDWTDLLRHNFPSTTAEGKITEHKPVTFDGVIELLDKHLALLPDNELSPEHLFRKMVTNKNIQDVANRANIIKNMCSSWAAISTSTSQKKCGLNDAWTIEPANSLVKQSRKQTLAGDSKPEVLLQTLQWDYGQEQQQQEKTVQHERDEGEVCVDWWKVVGELVQDDNTSNILPSL